MTSWYLALVKIFWLRTLATTDWYNWQLVYSHDVIDSNQSFQSSSHFVVNKGCFVEQVIEKKIKINNLFIDIKIWSTSIKLLGNSTLKKTTLSKFGEILCFYVVEMFSSKHLVHWGTTVNMAISFLVIIPFSTLYW